MRKFGSAIWLVLTFGVSRWGETKWGKRILWTWFILSQAYAAYFTMNDIITSDCNILTIIVVGVMWPVVWTAFWRESDWYKRRVGKKNG
jgi:hypothetical protein